MSTHGSPTSRRFVRTAWLMLAFQLLATAGAVGAGVWAFLEVRNVVNERANLQARVTELEAAQNQAAPASGPAPRGEPENGSVEGRGQPSLDVAPPTPSNPTRPRTEDRPDYDPPPPPREEEEEADREPPPQEQEETLRGTRL